MSFEEVVNNGTERKVSVYNKYRKGYKYNTPKGLDVLDNTEYNEVIYSSDYFYTYTLSLYYLQFNKKKGDYSILIEIVVIISKSRIRNFVSYT